MLFSLSLCLNICASLALCALSGLWSFLGDCAASLSRTFITATRAGGIIYSSTGCAAWHTLLIFIWVRGVGGGRGRCSGEGGACSRGSVWIFHRFQHFLLLVGRIQMAVNGCNVKCVPPLLPPPPPLSLPSTVPVPVCSLQTATYFLFNTVLVTCKTKVCFLLSESYTNCYAKVKQICQDEWYN